MKIIKLYIFTVICILAASLNVFAQESIRVSGKVSDSKGIPVQGAVVMLDGNTNVGTVTDMDGNYTLAVPNTKDAKLNVSCLSFQTQIISVNEQAIINVTLADDAVQLEDAVVVGYGSMRKSDLTGAVTSIKVDDDMASQTNSIDQILQGHAAGVQVVSNSSSPDAGVSILIRGAGSFNGSTQPLYVVDGIIMNTDSNTELIKNGDDSKGGDEATNGLMGINPQDIASMEILKDASATAIYGSQGANGVVLITTKSAKRSKPSISYNGGVYVNTPYKHLDVMNFDQYVGFLETIRDLGGTLGNNATSVLKYLYTSPDTHEGIRVTPTDWQDYLMRTTVNHSHFLSIAGKNYGTSYYFSLSYKKENGIVQKTGFDNFTTRLNLDHEIGKKVKIGTRTSFSWLKSDLVQGSSTARAGAASSMMRSMLSYYPALRINDDDIDDTTLVSEDSSSPKKWLEDYEQGRHEIRISPSVYLQWNILPWLSFKSTFGGDYRSTELNKYKSYRINTSNEASIGAIGRVSRIAYNFDNQFNFNKKLKSHNISGTIGMSMSTNSAKTQTIEGWNILQYRPLTESLNSAPNTEYSYIVSEAALMSAFGRLVYSFRDRYVLTTTLRYDGSSKFQGTKKWALFPSFALAWRIAEETWFNVPCISSLKLRAGWGQVGNQAVASYQTMSNFENAMYPDHTPSNPAHGSVAITPSNIANPGLKWETTEQVNIGLDLSMFKGRISLSVEFYNKDTKDLLQQKNLATSSGFKTMWMNMGNIRNRGFEATLEVVPVKTKNFEWSLSGNFSLNRGRIMSIGEGSEAGTMYIHQGEKVTRNYFWGKTVSVSYLPYPLNLFMEQEPMAVFYGMPTDGILKEGEKGVPMSDGSIYGPGQVKYIDTNKDGVISDLDRVIIGDPNPDFTYGFTTEFNYKNLKLRMSFNGSHGADIYNINKVLGTDVTAVTKNLYSAVVTDAWTPEHQNTWYTSINGLTSADTRWVSDRYIEDGSYLRLSNVSLTYRIPLKKKNFLRSLSLGVSGSNVFVWTRYSGWDPDVNSFGSMLLYGADMGSYPSARTFRFDLKLGF